MKTLSWMKQNGSAGVVLLVYPCMEMCIQKYIAKGHNFLTVKKKAQTTKFVSLIAILTLGIDHTSMVHFWVETLCIRNHCLYILDIDSHSDRLCDTLTLHSVTKSAWITHILVQFANNCTCSSWKSYPASPHVQLFPNRTRMHVITYGRTYQTSKGRVIDHVGSLTFLIIRHLEQIAS